MSAKRFKKSNEKKIQISEKELRRLKYEATEEAVGTASLLFLVAMRDELDCDEELCVKVMERVDRYSQFYKDHLVDLQDFAESLENKTGMKITFWQKGKGND